MRKIAEETRTNILQEQFIPDNVFIYVAKGAIRVFDGNKSQTLVPRARPLVFISE